MAIQFTTPEPNDRVSNANYSLRPTPSSGNPVFNRWVQDRIPLPPAPNAGQVFQGGAQASGPSTDPVNILRAGPGAFNAQSQKDAAGNTFMSGRTSGLESGLNALEQRSSNPDLYKNESAGDRARALSDSAQGHLNVASGAASAPATATSPMPSAAPTFNDARSGFGFGTIEDRWDPRAAGSIERRDAFGLGDKNSAGAKFFENTRESDLIKKDTRGDY